MFEKFQIADADGNCADLVPCQRKGGEGGHQEKFLRHFDQHAFLQFDLRDHQPFVDASQVTEDRSHVTVLGDVDGRRYHGLLVKLKSLQRCAPSQLEGKGLELVLRYGEDPQPPQGAHGRGQAGQAVVVQQDFQQVVVSLEDIGDVGQVHALEIEGVGGGGGGQARDCPTDPARPGSPCAAIGCGRPPGRETPAGFQLGRGAEAIACLRAEVCEGLDVGEGGRERLEQVDVGQELPQAPQVADEDGDVDESVGADVDVDEVKEGEELGHKVGDEVVGDVEVCQGKVGSMVHRKVEHARGGEGDSLRDLHPWGLQTVALEGKNGPAGQGAQLRGKRPEGGVVVEEKGRKLGESPQRDWQTLEPVVLGGEKFQPRQVADLQGDGEAAVVVDVELSEVDKEEDGGVERLQILMREVQDLRFLGRKQVVEVGQDSACSLVDHFPRRRLHGVALEAQLGQGGKARHAGSKDLDPVLVDVEGSQIGEEEDRWRDVVKFVPAQVEGCDGAVGLRADVDVCYVHPTEIKNLRVFPFPHPHEEGEDSWQTLRADLWGRREELVRRVHLQELELREQRHLWQDFKERVLAHVELLQLLEEAYALRESLEEVASDPELLQPDQLGNAAGQARQPVAGDIEEQEALEEAERRRDLLQVVACQPQLEESREGEEGRVEVRDEVVLSIEPLEPGEGEDRGQRAEEIDKFVEGKVKHYEVGKIANSSIDIHQDILADRKEGEGCKRTDRRREASQLVPVKQQSLDATQSAVDRARKREKQQEVRSNLDAQSACLPLKPVRKLYQLVVPQVCKNQTLHLPEGRADRLYPAVVRQEVAELQGYLMQPVALQEEHTQVAELPYLWCKLDQAVVVEQEILQGRELSYGRRDPDELVGIKLEGVQQSQRAKTGRKFNQVIVAELDRHESVRQADLLRQGAQLQALPVETAVHFCFLAPFKEHGEGIWIHLAASLSSTGFLSTFDLALNGTSPQTHLRLAPQDVTNLRPPGPRAIPGVSKHPPHSSSSLLLAPSLLPLMSELLALRAHRTNRLCRMILSDHGPALSSPGGPGGQPHHAAARPARLLPRAARALHRRAGPDSGGPVRRLDPIRSWRHHDAMPDRAPAAGRARPGGPPGAAGRSRLP
eukprot:765976-Hanusia_phi.AAC.14